MISSLQELNDQPVWLAWRVDSVGERMTKVPYSPHGGMGDASNPDTWGLRDDAEQRAAQIVNGLGGGIGVALGIKCAGGLQLGGIDLDTCLNGDNIEEWATEVVIRFASYTEISPSGNGAKVFFMYRGADLDRLRGMMSGEKKSGRKFARPGATDHPPAIEVYISNRFFTVTGDVLDAALSNLRIIDIDDLSWLLQEYGPAFAAAGKANSSTGTGPRDHSRSAAAYRLGLKMRRAGASYDEFVQAVRNDPGTADWYTEKGVANNDRELRRIWEKAQQAEDRERFVVDDFYAYLPQHNYIFVPTRSHWPASSVNSQIASVMLTDENGRPKLDAKGKPVSVAATTWLDQNRAVEQLTWAPGLPEIIHDGLLYEGGWLDRPRGMAFNLYMPPRTEPGDPALAEPWVEHVKLIYPDDAGHLFDWLAHRVQKPEEKINHAIVLGGEQGIGKDTLLEPVKEAIGRWNFQEVNPTQMLGRFNGYLRAVILRVSEARDLGEYDRFKFYEHLKAITAAPPDVLRIDEKHIREYPILNVCGVVFTTNHKSDGIYLPEDDRRHFVAWSNMTKDSARFSQAYWKRLHDPELFRNVAAWLRARDISRFDPKAPPPKTAAFYAILDAGRAPEEPEIADVLDALDNPDAVTLSRIQSKAEGDFAEWLTDRRNRRIIPHRLEKCGYVPVRNPDAGDGLWKIWGKRQAVYAKSSLPLRDQIAAARKL
jgi:Family of unknown function (DUF5906)